jgi:hypothetical protein
MAYKVNFKEIETIGLEKSPAASSLAGLRANEARYFWNKYHFEYVVYPALDRQKEVAWLKELMKAERQLEFASPILEVAIYEDQNLYWPEFIYQNGMIINVLYEKKGEKAQTGGGHQTG